MTLPQLVPRPLQTSAPTTRRYPALQDQVTSQRRSEHHRNLWASQQDHMWERVGQSHVHDGKDFTPTCGVRDVGPGESGGNRCARAASGGHATCQPNEWDYLTSGDCALMSCHPMERMQALRFVACLKPDVKDAI